MRRGLPGPPQLRLLAGICFGLCVGLGLACTTKTITDVSLIRADGGDEAGAGACLGPAPDGPRAAGQACACGEDCATGNCVEGVCCAGAACGAKRDIGAACADGAECSSGFCADGVCCNVACSGPCVACNQPDQMGECFPVASGFKDPHGLCRDDGPESCGQSGACNGAGGCARYPAETMCAP